MGNPREGTSTHTLGHLEEIKTGLTAFQRFHSLLMVPPKTRSWSKLLDKSVSASRAMVGETTLTFFQEVGGDGLFSGGSIAGSSSSPLLSFRPDASVGAVLFSLFSFFLPARSSASALPVLTVSAGVSPPPLTSASQSRCSAEPPSPALANQNARADNRQARCHCE